MQPQHGQQNPHAGSKREDVDIEQIIERSGCFEESTVLCSPCNIVEYVHQCNAHLVAIAASISVSKTCVVLSQHTQIYAALEECLGEHSRDWRKCQ
eukprot:19660-Heterococcus_DN1.PRE.1